MNKHVVFLFSLLLLASCTGKRQENSPADHLAATVEDTLAPVRVTVLASLRDSLQPKTVFLKNVPKPLVVAVPGHSGGSHSFTASNGEIHKVNLEPPIKKLLPVLQNEKGEAIKDKDGKPFILGNGGQSNFTNFTTDNGLALDGVTCSFMDQAGNLWFGTDGGGVSRYDGKSFTTFSNVQGLANNIVYSIAGDKAGNVWFGTYGGGVSRYDGKSFTTFTTAQGLANNIVYSIAEDKSGNLWFGTLSGGASRYDGKSFTTFSIVQGLVNNNVFSIVEDKAGNLWFGTNGGASRYDGKSFTTFTTSDGLGSNFIRNMAVDKAGKVWFATHGGGVSCYDPRQDTGASPRTGSKSFTTFTTAQGLAANSVLSVACDNEGNTWFGTSGGGVSCYDGKSFVTYSTAQGLANNNVRSITCDRMGNLWFGTHGGGASRYNGGAFTIYTTAQGLSNNDVFSIAGDKAGNLWFGSQGGGASCYDGVAFTTYSLAQGLNNNIVLSIAGDTMGNLWFGTYGSGVSCFDGRSFTSYSTAQGLANNTVRSLVMDRAGNLWFGTDGGGVSRFDGKSFISYTTAQGLANNTVLSITEDKTGAIWFGTLGGGVSRYDGTSFTTFSIAQGLADNSVFSIVEDKTGNLWFGTAEGLSVMNAGQVGKLHTTEGSELVKSLGGRCPRFFKTFTKKDDLPDNFVTQVLQLPDGRMAIGTNLGITLFNVSPDVTTLTSIEIYNSLTDCPVKDINVGQKCMYLDSKGVIWAATGNEKNALVRFDPSALHTNSDPPNLVVQSIKVNEENISWYDMEPAESTEQSASGTKAGITPTGDKSSQPFPANITEEVATFGKILTERERDSMRHRFEGLHFEGITPYYPVPQHLTLPYRQNQITIDFAAVEVDKPGLVNYRYILEGYDKDWSPVSKKTSATFGNISEGAYTFKVMAQGPNAVWSAPVSYTFKVLPPWYRTWWAYTIYVLLFLLALRMFTKWRERNLRYEKEKLEQKVEERTEELVQKNIIVERERQRSDDLLLNILPEEVATELKTKGTTTAKYFENVTVLFTDFVDFTSAGERMNPQSLIDELHTCFKEFDEITGKYGIEKIKTIGDAYLAVAGLPAKDPDHAEHIVRAAIEINAFMQSRIAQLGDKTFDIRIGIHSGDVVAGIVGVKKFAYDIWGDTVNTAARMEQHSESGKINISQTTYELVKDKIPCTYRGEIDAKGKGMLKMYFVS